jgi:hypothetical protein
MLDAALATEVELDLPRILSAEQRDLANEMCCLPSSATALPCEEIALYDRGTSLLSGRIVIPNDPLDLLAIYRTAIST